MKQWAFLGLLIGLSGSSAAQLSESELQAILAKDAREQVRLALSRKPPNALLTRGAVPSEHVAIQIHVAVTGAVFGEQHIRDQHPYKAVSSGNFWVVYGSVPGNALGGSAVSVIRKSNGQVLSVTHGQ